MVSALRSTLSAALLALARLINPPRVVGVRSMSPGHSAMYSGH